MKHDILKNTNVNSSHKSTVRGQFVSAPGLLPRLGSEKGRCCEKREMPTYDELPLVWFLPQIKYRERYFSTAACTRDWLVPSLGQNQGHCHCRYHRHHHRPHLPPPQNRFHHLKLPQ